MFLERGSSAGSVCISAALRIECEVTRSSTYCSDRHRTTHRQIQWKYFDRQCDIRRQNPKQTKSPHNRKWLSPVSDIRVCFWGETDVFISGSDCLHRIPPPTASYSLPKPDVTLEALAVPPIPFLYGAHVYTYAKQSSFPARAQ